MSVLTSVPPVPWALAVAVAKLRRLKCSMAKLRRCLWPLLWFWLQVLAAALSSAPCGSLDLVTVTPDQTVRAKLSRGTQNPTTIFENLS
jgi:hypothetical protein